MKVNESSIYISLKQLREKLYEVQFLMSKTDRIIYGTPLIEECRDTMKCFVMAFTIDGKEEKTKYLIESIGYFGVLRCDLECIVTKNIIHFPQPKLKPEELKTAVPANKVSKQKILLFELIAKIDNEMCRWYNSLSKGKTIVD